MGKDDARLRSCRSGVAMSLLQAASLNTVVIYFLNGYFKKNCGCFCVRVCVCRRSRLQESRSIPARVRTSRACIPCAQDSQSANRLSLCFAGRRLPNPHLSGMGCFFCTID